MHLCIRSVFSWKLVFRFASIYRIYPADSVLFWARLGAFYHLCRESSIFLLFYMFDSPTVWKVEELNKIQKYEHQWLLALWCCYLLNWGILDYWSQFPAVWSYHLLSSAQCHSTKPCLYLSMYFQLGIHVLCIAHQFIFPLSPMADQFIPCTFNGRPYIVNGWLIYHTFIFYGRPANPTWESLVACFLEKWLRALFGRPIF